MSSKMPPVPPAERSDKGPGSDPKSTRNDPERGSQKPENIDQTGERGNIRQNTRNQGYQQDR